MKKCHNRDHKEGKKTQRKIINVLMSVETYLLHNKSQGNMSKQRKDNSKGNMNQCANVLKLTDFIAVYHSAMHQNIDHKDSKKTQR